VASERSYVCGFCDRTSDPHALSCSGCGAPTDVRAVIGPSGWLPLPAIRDMARLEFGHSSCQIEGAYAPVADFALAADERIYFTHHVLLWKDESTALSPMPLAGAWTRLWAGLPLVMVQAKGPGRIALSQDIPGEMIAVPIDVGHSVHVREHVFLAATGSVEYDWFQPDVWWRTGEPPEKPYLPPRDTRLTNDYPLGQLMDRFAARSAPGLLLLHGAGNVFVRRLAQGEMILVKPTALLYTDATVRMLLHIEHPVRGITVSRGLPFDRYMCLRLYGPGRVAIRSGEKHLEDSLEPLVATSPKSEFRHRPEFWGAARQWYVQFQDKTWGPYREDQIEGLKLSHAIPPTALVWREDK